MLSRADVLRHEFEICGAYANRIDAHELSGETQDVGGRGRSREVVVRLPALRRLLTGLAGDDEGLEISLAKRWHRAEGGLDAIRRAVDADGDVVVANSRVPNRVE